MEDLRSTNRLLAAIFVLMLAQTWMLVERSVEADTLRLDYCITQKMEDTPEQYLHVIAHPPVAKKE